MIEMLDRPLAGFDPDLVSVLVEGTQRMGIELHLQTKVQRLDLIFAYPTRASDAAYMV